jgi:hypothetical protein
MSTQPIAKYPTLFVVLVCIGLLVLTGCQPVTKAAAQTQIPIADPNAIETLPLLTQMPSRCSKPSNWVGWNSGF